MKLYVPRIYGNEQSLGRRDYQRQRVQGIMNLHYAEDGSLVDVTFDNMVNLTHRMSNGQFVTYPNTELDDRVFPKFNAVGDNKTGKFKKASVCFYLAAEPVFNVGDFTEDNALYVMVAGRGRFHSKYGCLRYVSGKVAGALGCGCVAYGHVSPTRKIGFYGPTDDVDDVAAVEGTWTAKLVKRGSLATLR